MPEENKIVVVLGPTSSGKSDLAVALAKKFNGEIISADSRQVYKGMNIGTGKITKKEMGGIKHYLLDVISPKKVFTVAKYKDMALTAIKKIIKNNKLPIICGGTGLYLKSIVDDLTLPEVPPNQRLRKKIESKSVEELFEILRRMDARRAAGIDRYNPRRLIRAIEIATVLGKVPKISSRSENCNYNFLEIGLTLPKEVLAKKILTRLLKRMKNGMIYEVNQLHEKGISWKRLYDLGLEYRFVAKYLRKEISREEMTALLYTAIVHYARRQMTWFKRDKRIKWFKKNEYKKIEREVENFLGIIPRYSS